MSLKARVQNGTAFAKNVKIEFNGEVEELVIKPVSNKDFENIQAYLNEGKKVYKDPKFAAKNYIDLADSTHRSFEANVRVVLAGVVEEGLTKEDIEQLPAGFVNKIAEEILDLTGVKQKVNKEENSDSEEENVKN